MARIAYQALCGPHRCIGLRRTGEALCAVGGILSRFACGAPVLKRGGDRARLARFARRGRGGGDVARGARNASCAAWRVAPRSASDAGGLFGIGLVARVARQALGSAHRRVGLRRTGEAQCTCGGKCSGGASDTRRALGIRARPWVALCTPLAVAGGVALGAWLANARLRLRARFADLALGAAADHNARARVARVALGASDRRIVVRRARRAPEGVLRRKRSRTTPPADGDRTGSRIGVETRKLARGEALRACGWK